MGRHCAETDSTLRAQNLNGVMASHPQRQMHKLRSLALGGWRLTAGVPGVPLFLSGVVGYTCDPNTWEAEAWGHPFKANLAIQ